MGTAKTARPVTTQQESKKLPTVSGFRTVLAVVQNNCTHERTTQDPVSVKDGLAGVAPQKAKTLMLGMRSGCITSLESPLTIEVSRGTLLSSSLSRATMVNVRLQGGI
jgi:hypothetical protein